MGSHQNRSSKFRSFEWCKMSHVGAKVCPEAIARAQTFQIVRVALRAIPPGQKTTSNPLRVICVLPLRPLRPLRLHFLDRRVFRRNATAEDAKDAMVRRRGSERRDLDHSRIAGRRTQRAGSGAGGCEKADARGQTHRCRKTAGRSAAPRIR